METASNDGPTGLSRLGRANRKSATDTPTTGDSMPERATGVKGKDLFPLTSIPGLRHSISMPSISMPQGALVMLILRVLEVAPSHGYAIAQRIHQLSGQVLDAE